jgi:hypothetical protein
MKRMQHAMRYRSQNNTHDGNKNEATEKRIAGSE